MDHESQKPSRRMGPVGFSAQKKVTSYRGPSGPDSASGSASGVSSTGSDTTPQRNLGQASGPTLETPTRSKELKVMPLSVWYLASFAVVVMGLVLVAPALSVLGLIGCVAVYFAGRSNRTEARLRSDFFEADKG